ncbi:cyclic pyranopterin monophosphate synthase MoaC [Deinococcus roseus]|uniref:Cyclic pyranopterin monophosphate synthase n=1 Tax=Deinococcus roseus TaxID=392414 RepID=A0ABQ2D222_9DEIO|nr:cyclic pyranopterin monophosphate synthase MoaC [Deinococcus roseus]GGJ37051.1 cyclic pyranopterin monophosphate synthase accessory protein [Deinococcus roseus]
MSELTHFEEGAPRMVDVADKPSTTRTAQAEAIIMLPEPARLALQNNPKGDPLMVAQLAGIMGAKKTSDLIPLCHPLPIKKAGVEIEPHAQGLRVIATVKTEGQTGVEMEALTAVSVAALTVYDMLKAASKGIEIQNIRLLSKTGGKSGDYHAEEQP